MASVARSALTLLAACADNAFLELEPESTGAIVLNIGDDGQIIEASLALGEIPRHVAVRPAGFVAVVSVPGGGFVDVSGRTLDPKELTVSFAATACRARSFSWPLRLDPGDVCPLPQNAATRLFRFSGSSAIEDDAHPELIARARSSVRVVRVGVHPGLPKPTITADSITTSPAYPAEALELQTLSLAHNGFLAAVAPGHVVLAPPHEHPTWIRAGPRVPGPLLSLDDSALLVDHRRPGHVLEARPSGVTELDTPELANIVVSGLAIDPETQRLFLAGGAELPASGARSPELASCEMPLLGACRTEAVTRRSCGVRRLVDVAFLGSGRAIAIGEGSEPFVRTGPGEPFACRSGPTPETHEGETLELDDVVDGSMSIVETSAFFCARAKLGPRRGSAVLRAPLRFDGERILVEVAHFEPGAGCESSTVDGNLVRLTLRPGLVVSFDASGRIAERWENAGLEGPLEELGAPVRQYLVNGSSAVALLMGTSLSTRAGSLPLERIFGPSSLEGEFALATHGTTVYAFGRRLLRIDPTSSEPSALVGPALEGQIVAVTWAFDESFLVSRHLGDDWSTLRLDAEGAQIGQPIPSPKPILALAALDETWVLALDLEGTLLASRGDEFEPVELSHDDPTTPDLETAGDIPVFRTLDSAGRVGFAGGPGVFARILGRGDEPPIAEPFWLPHVLPASSRGEVLETPPDVHALRALGPDRVELGIRGAFVGSGFDERTERSVAVSLRADASPLGFASTERAESDSGELPVAFAGPDAEVLVLDGGRMLVDGDELFLSSGSAPRSSVTIGQVSVIADRTGVLTTLSPQPR
ncbi:MAG: hypothetical protein HYV07_20800 [Deltaproteobacteria bacterium]|nr:hypothetical protein [Deltaproteobacteria bacterium]